MHLVDLIKENKADVIHVGSEDSFVATAQLTTNQDQWLINTIARQQLQFWETSERKINRKERNKKVGGHFWRYAILLCAEMFFWFQRNGFAHDATMTKHQTHENAKIKDHILCTCKNISLQHHAPPSPLNHDLSHNSAISIRSNNTGTASSLSCLCKFAGARISSVNEGD